MSDFVAGNFSFGPGQSVAQVQHGSDDGLHVEFYNEAVQNMAKTKTEGRAIFEEVPYISIMFPGDKTKRVVRPVTFEDDPSAGTLADVHRFPRQYAAFKAGEEQIGDGLPVQQWGYISKSQALELKSMGIHTVEQMSKLPDSALTWLGARELREHAKSWLDKGAAHAHTAQLVAEKEQMQAQIDTLKAQYDDLAAKAQNHQHKESKNVPK